MAPPGPSFRAPGQRQRQSVWAMLTAFTLLAMMGFQLAHATDLQPRAPIANGVELRVLALGDSITYGAGDANYNGYRGPLYAQLTARGNTVDMVGRQHSGTFADTAHEGYRGFFISEIGASSSLGRYAGPNIVLMHAGTNDMHKNIDILNAPSRLGDLIELVFETAPDAVIFVAQIIPADNAVKQARINDFNAAVPGVVQGFLDKGKKVVIVRMDRALSVADLHDELHPSVAGYAKMADAWYEAIEAADVDGLITKPGKAMAPPPTPAGPENCRPSPNWYKTGAKALGPQAAYNDGPFKPNWANRGVIAEGACPRSKVHFFDLDGDGLKDYGCVQPQNGATSVWRNIPDANGRASGEWEALGEIATGRDGRDGTGVMFADLNGDGFDDYIYVADNGEVEGFINLGSRNADGVWRWKGLGRIAGGVGATNETLQLVDLNGDGRADFCIVNQDTGEVTGWWNTGISDMPDYHKVGVIATGESFGPDSKVILADLSGNGRADYLMVGLHGKMTGFLNRRQEKGVVPRWMRIFDVADGPEGTEQDEVFLVDITGDGKVDYLRVNKNNGRTELWENLGTGGKFQVGDGVMLPDLNGDGVADYFWVDQDGRGFGYINAGGPQDAWHSVGRIAEGTGNGRSRVHTAVLTSSGRADYVVVEESIGQASWWENLGPDTDYAWQARGVFATGPKNTVETKFGWKFDSRNVRFADLNGDGFDDYLYISEFGAVAMWQHTGRDPPDFHAAKLVADGVGVAPMDIQFADTNGDGLLDYVVLGRVTGEARVWINKGFKDDGSIAWAEPISFAAGTGSPNTNIRLAEMTGENERWDWVSIDPDHGALTLWHNQCYRMDGGGDDDTDLPGGGFPELPDGDYDNTPSTEWMDPKYNCMNEAVQQVTMPPDERWEAVLAPDAWKYALWAWRKRINDSDRILTFSQHVSQTLDYSQNMNCGDLNDQNGCYGDAKCDEQDPGPAAYFIILSFQTISKTLRNIYAALGDARDRVENQIGTFASKFAPGKEDDGLSTIIILDILSLGYAGAMAPIWNKWVSQTQWGSKNGNGPTAQAFTDGMTLQGITLAKDILAQNVWEAEKVLETQVDNVVFSWQNATSEYAQSLFDGTQVGISMLGILLTEGKMIDPRLSLPGPIDLDLQIRRTLWALLIPAGWSISGRDLNPFIVDTGLSCEDAPKDDDLQLRLEKDTLNDKIICDKKADRAYYLVSATDPKGKCRHGSNTGGYGCDKFEDLPGADELVGTTPEDEEDSQSLHWQMVDVEDIVFGSLATYKANGNKNVEEPQRFNDWESSSDWGEMLESLVDSDIRAPWVFTIPVCGVNEALWNYFYSTSTDRADRDPTFPCGENEWTDY